MSEVNATKEASQAYLGYIQASILQRQCLHCFSQIVRQLPQSFVLDAVFAGEQGDAVQVLQCTCDCPPARRQAGEQLQQGPWECWKQAPSIVQKALQGITGRFFAPEFLTQCFGICMEKLEAMQT